MKIWRAAKRFRTARAAALLWLPLPAAFGHDVISTKLLWTQEISRIVYKHCATCHRDGGGAMSLMTYQEARPWAKAIRDEVLQRRMPPWGAVKGVGEFRDDPSLSQIEIDMIVNWVEGGAPDGDEAYLPPAPHFEPPPRPAPPAANIDISSSAPRILDADTTVTGIRPLRLAPGASLDVAAYKPDGAVEHLIWLRHWRPEWERTYYLQRPVRLPKGTRIAAYSGQPAEAALAISK
jgi:mono/diheme cytochrome c family protein